MPLADFLYSEDRYKVLTKPHPAVAAELLEQAQEGVRQRWAKFKRMAEMVPGAATI